MRELGYVRVCVCVCVCVLRCLRGRNRCRNWVDGELGCRKLIHHIRWFWLMRTGTFPIRVLKRLSGRVCVYPALRNIASFSVRKPLMSHIHALPSPAFCWVCPGRREMAQTISLHETLGPWCQQQYFGGVVGFA